MSPLVSAYGVSPITAITASKSAASTPSAVSLKVTLPSPAASRNPASRLSPFGKSAFVLPVPCHDRVQPPLWLPMSSADLPTTRIFLPRASGSAPSRFFSSTSDLRTASRSEEHTSELQSLLRLSYH